MRLVVTPCNCREGEPLADGTMPEFYANGEVPAARFEALYLARVAGRDPPYWAVHLDGRHVLSVEP